ncbi:14.7 kDa heat shock protein [Cardamine amara subsp. amara]|uniref:14.7 kDa heat shock protein n=1 Tax=Cardamine amara subsp. amara TaxID=228776 RepID=A0ABD1B4X6_CARAN
MSGSTTMNAGSSTGNSFPRPRKNPFLKSGSEGKYEVTETNKACVMRVDMPGCPESDLTYWVDESNIHFFADEPNIPDQHSGRKYGGSMVINPEFFNVKEANAKLINGVLWITVPKISGKTPPCSFTQKIVFV